MSSADQTKAPVILQPYLGSADTRLRRRLRAAIAPTTIIFCFLMGLLFAYSAPYFLPPFAVPIAVLGACALWALPAARTAPTALLNGLFFAFLILLIMWPNYVALSLPGLPWITMARLTGIPLALTLLVCVSVSADFRARSAEALRALPMLWKLLAAFVVIQFLSIFVSKAPLDSVQKFIVDQIGWTAVFFASVYLFLKPGRAERWAYVLWFMAIGVGLVALVEKHQGHVPWAGHIPSFLKIADPSVQAALAGGSRASNGIYRLQSTFSTALGLAEYLALTFPFLLNFVVGRYHWLVRTAAFATIPFILYVILGSGSRLGMVGFLLGLLFYLLFWAMLRWRRQKGSILGPAITLAYPVIFSLAVTATILSERLRAVVWGNGPQQDSTDSRIAQYKSGVPMVLTHPWGHGIGMSGLTLGVRNSQGQLTIDTYWLAIALDYGVIGFIIYYSMIFLSIYYAGLYTLTARKDDRDYGLLVPLGIALISFFVVKSVFAQEDNHPLIFMMMGVIVALVYRIKQETSRTVGTMKS